jgi:medium-chain acyl-[acyl-carrier-protein] hydrolase
MASGSGLMQISPSAEGDYTLICMPQAGAGANVFRRWGRYPELRGTAIWAARLPGREKRLMEPPVESIEEMAELLVESALGVATGPIVLFGHCSGALVAYEMAHLLNAVTNGPRVACLVISAQQAPLTFPEVPEVSVSELSARELLDRVAGLEGTPQKVLANEEVIQMILPAIRADMLAVERYYDRGNRSRLGSPIVAFGGKQDSLVSAEDLCSWENLTEHSFALHLIDGGHFFLDENQESVVQQLALVIQGIEG